VEIECSLPTHTQARLLKEELFTYASFFLAQLQGLTKAPEDYADAKVQPHVQVALRLKSKGISIRAGDTVPYVICIHEGTPAPKGSYAERAYHPDEVTQPGSGLTIGM
jgi:hypothetical protein